MTDRINLLKDFEPPELPHPKPCPQCHHDEWQNVNHGVYAEITCLKCGHAVMGRDMHDAVDRWNIRQPDAEAILDQIDSDGHMTAYRAGFADGKAEPNLAERELAAKVEGMRELTGELARVSRFEYRSAEDAWSKVQDVCQALIAAKEEGE